MKKKILGITFILALLLCLPIAAGAEIIDSGDCGADGDNVTWTFDDSGTLTISGEGDMVQLDQYSLSPWNELEDDVKRVVIEDGVTSISEYSFPDFNQITDISIPASVSYIGTPAFYWCTSLTNFYVDEDNPNYCSVDGNLFSKDMMTLIQYALGKTNTHYEIPNGVKSISAYAFSYARNLTNVIIPDSVSDIGEHAFHNCYITNLVLPSNLKKINMFAFHQCGRLNEITIPDGVTEIGYWAFNECYNLTQITLPKSIQEIGSWAFGNLKDVFYKGTKNEWNNINISNRNNWDLLSGATIHYTAIGTAPPKIDSITQNERNIEIQLADVEYDSDLITVFCDSNGMVDFERIGISASDMLKTAAIPDGTKTVRVFIWDSLNGMRPLCKTEKVDIN